MIDFRGAGSGKRFEEIVLERLRTEATLGNGHFGRYGVQAAVMGRTADGSAIAQITPSLPDIEGLLSPSGRQVILDCKVESSGSFNLWEFRPPERDSAGKIIEKAGSKRRQLKHMIDRSRFGAICFFLIHWNSRQLKTRFDETVTIAVPVHFEIDFWVEFESGGLKSISRSEAVAMGYVVEWNTLTSREKKLRPDVLAVAHKITRPVRSRIVFDAWSP